METLFRITFISFMLLTSCRSDKILPLSTLLHTETFVSANLGFGDVYYDSVKVFYYDASGRRTGTGDYNQISETYTYFGNDSIYFTGPEDTAAYLLNDQGYPEMSIHSTTNGTQTDYIVDTTYYYYSGSQLDYIELHQSAWLYLLYVHKDMNTYYSYAANGDLIADSTFDLNTGEVILRNNYTYLTNEDPQQFNQLYRFPYLGTMSSHLLLSEDSYKYFGPFSIETHSAYSYLFNDAGLPLEKFTAVESFDEMSGQTTLADYRYKYNWVTE